jgi:hypothetical protein
MHRLLLLVASFCSACASPSADIADSNAASTSSAVVGGQAEARYPAAGYLGTGKNAASLSGAHCGVSLLAPRVAVTAGHCIRLSSAAAFGIGFGTVGSGKIYAARTIFVHPDYDPNGDPRSHHDVAFLALADSVTDVTPAGIREAATGDAALYVGYGRTTEGDVNVTTGYTQERKSATESVTTVDATNVFSTGGNGGLCWGDSGGPLLDPESGDLFGVLADFDHTFYCKTGNKMIFTSLAAERTLVERAISCGDAADFLSCMK